MDLDLYLKTRALPAEEYDKAAQVARGGIVATLIIPAFNEDRRLPPTMMEVIDFFDARKEPYEIIVVDDGSRDGTSDLIRRFQEIRPQVKLITFEQNQGKGSAVRTGALAARGKYVIFADADGSTPIDQFDRLRSAIDNGANIAIGSRALKSAETEVFSSLHRRVFGRAFNYCVRAFLIPGIADTQCGFKMFSREAAQFVFAKQKSNRFSFDLEILHVANRARLRIDEIPINWAFVDGSKVNLFLDAAKMFRDIFIFRWRHRHVTPEAFSEYRRNVLGAIQPQAT